MLSPRLTNCPECANIPSLLKKIDCKLAELGNSLYNNVSYMLNQPIPAGDILQLIAYRRILTHKYCNPNYLHEYSVAMIASRVIRITVGCVSRCNTPEPCLEVPCDITIVQNPSTTTTSTSTLPPPPTTTTTTTIELVRYYLANQYTCPDCNTSTNNARVKVIGDGLNLGSWYKSAIDETQVFHVTGIASFDNLAELVDVAEYLTCPSICTPTTTTTTTITPTTTTTTTSSGTTTTTTTICQDCVPHDVAIGTQVWTGCNLDVDTYRNGDPIPEVTDPIDWQNATTGAWCYMVNDPIYGPGYGKLYNWYAVNDPRGLAPIGYHVPSDAEFTILTDYLGGEATSGSALKETGRCHWGPFNLDATNSSGLALVGAGQRSSPTTVDPYAFFANLGTYCTLWSSDSDEVFTNAGIIRYVNVNQPFVVNYFYTKWYGFSVRLIKDTEPITTTTTTITPTTTTTTTSGTTTTTTTCNGSTPHPYPATLIFSRDFITFIGSLVDACQAAACLQAGTCNPTGVSNGHFDDAIPVIGGGFYGATIGGCTPPITTGYHVINLSGTYTVINMLNGYVVSYPTC